MREMFGSRSKLCQNLKPLLRAVSAFGAVTSRESIEAVKPRLGFSSAASTAIVKPLADLALTDQYSRSRNQTPKRS